MDKRSLLAVVLSALVLMIWLTFTQEPAQNTAPNNTNTNEINSNTQNNNFTINPVQNDTVPQPEIIPISTDIYDIKFSSKNATIQSLIIKTAHSDSSTEIEQSDLDIIPNGDLEQAFRILWGDNTDVSSSPDIYYQVKKNGNTIDFYKDFTTSENKVFTVHKIYTIKEGEYVIELQVQISNSSNEVLNLGNNFAYSLFYGPQLGPAAEIADTQKSKQLSTRRLAGRDIKKVRFIRLKNNRAVEKADLYKWVGITGRYISMLILTGSASYTTQFSAFDVPGLNSGAQILLQRPEIQSSAVVDKYRIYIGPNVNKVLKRYNQSETNAFGIQNANFDDIKKSRLLDILQVPMHALMLFLYNKVFHNYGFAIIVLTLLMRIITLPIINKSKETGKRMKALGPKMQAIKEKYKDDPMKMNQATMELYRKEKVSPFSSMLPMFIQLPIFLSMYRVIYESIELWQAPFIGWMHDLSVPDQLFSFGDFTIPFLGWSSFNLLPIIMISTQYISSFIMMRQQDTSAAGSQKLIFVMSYVFPFMIFFVLYNSPSGLILYWICSNIFTIFSMTDWKKGKAVKEQEGIIKKKRSKIKT